MAMARRRPGEGLAGAFVSCVIGAGFASGRETQQFFGRFGTGGILGALIAGAGFALGGALILGLCRYWDLADYRALFTGALGPKLSRWADPVSGLMLLTTLAVVLSAAGSLVASLWPVPAWPGSLAAAGAIAALVAGGPARVLRAQAALVPAIVLGAVALAAAAMGHAGPRPASLPSRGFAASALLFLGYNLLLALLALPSLARRAPDPRSAARSGLAGGTVVGVAAACLALVHWRLPLAEADLPALSAARALAAPLHAYYLVVLALAILLSGTAFCQGIVARLSSRESLPRPSRIAAVLGLGLAGSCLGLKTLVAVVYPVMGYAGLVIIGGLGARLWFAGLELEDG